jgi:lipopolysaccharide/colanic/teichoic acid biosynthesis glycosyltransferase
MTPTQPQASPEAAGRPGLVDTPKVSPSELRSRPRFPTWKRTLDLAVALPGLILALPVIGAAAVAMRLNGDDGPVLYRATRVGEAGRPFMVLKLRTMRVAGSTTGMAVTASGDPRVTRVGRVLRRTKLDELPQLWNVIRGEMSLVGPRPEDPRFVDWTQPHHAIVFAARPGITGPAQIAFRDEERMLSGEDVERTYVEQVLPRKVELDAGYLEDPSLAGDVRLLLRTVGAVFR